jgi:hypothetical protein
MGGEKKKKKKPVMCFDLLCVLPVFDTVIERNSTHWYSYTVRTFLNACTGVYYLVRFYCSFDHGLLVLEALCLKEHYYVWFRVVEPDGKIVPDVTEV